MHLYSILVATLGLTVSIAFAGNQYYEQQSLTDCLNLCHDDPNDYKCPPTTEKQQLSSGCWTCCDKE
ncbi:hypothetical protein PENNAL_c0003G06040 [Penicillium nalgiovense]|uniref:Secreted protein n=1 Tax=Penicillium nalgiovense TaxID=60175 RepID=A0A1V6Z573_PENNA|nr:hypothetical protein PENNAL_c0003G06040 [Penicillium nalgiovense]